MTHGLRHGKPGPRAANPITPPYVENNSRIEVKITFMLIAYLVLLCEFFWEFSIFQFCRPLVDIYWHPLLKSCVLKNYISKDDVAVYCLFLFFIFSGKIFQLSIIEETHQMTSQGNYKLNDVLSTDILESGLPLFVQVLQIFNYLFFLLRNQPVTSTLKNQKVIMIIEQ